MSSLDTVAKNLPLCKYRYALFVSYIGTKYLGSQRQIGREQRGEEDTVQEAIEAALENFLPKKRCKLTGSSRTDRGVHALMNCYTLPLMDHDMPPDKMRNLLNFHLSKKNHEIQANQVILAPPDFHPRRNAIGREYIYRIAVVNQSRKRGFTVSHYPLELFHLMPVTELYRILPLPCFNTDKVIEVMELFRGEHDFKSFCNVNDDPPDTIRDMEIDLVSEPTNSVDLNHEQPYDICQLHFKSRSFLYNQVRRMVGTIITYATYGKTELSHIKKLVDEPSSTKWSSNMIMAEPWGLYLNRVNYDKSAFECNDGDQVDFDDSDDHDEAQ